MPKFAVFIEVEGGWPVQDATTTEIAEAVEFGLDRLFAYDLRKPKYTVDAHLVTEQHKPKTELQWQQGHLNSMTARDVARMEANKVYLDAVGTEGCKASIEAFSASRTGMKL